MKRRIWTEKQVAYLTRHYHDRDTEMLCRRLNRTAKQIYRKARYLGLHKPHECYAIAGRKGAHHPQAIAHRFKKGQTAHNKGKRIEEFMSPEAIERSSRTRFKPGNMPAHTKPIGYERVDKKNGCIYIKVAMDKKMMLKHRWVWQQHHGEIPPGHCVSFRDGNRQNCDISNLFLISREDNARRRAAEETEEQRRKRIALTQEKRNKLIRRDRIRIHFGLEPKSKLVKRW